jgi:uncharacterized repeat protein (TIGR01451 family)
VATYNGDSNNTAVSSGTASELVTITPAAPTVTTSQQPATATVGTSIADKATVSGGFNPTGTVTFHLYNNPNGTGTPLFTDPNVPLVSGMATSTGYSTTATGTVYWVATYNGDSNNSSVTSGTAVEPVVITPATPTISTSQQPATATVGTSIADKATVSGGFNPTGTVTFHLYNNSSGTGTPLFTDANVPLVSGMATSTSFTTTATGTDYWVATYNGDSNNSPVSSGTALEPVTIAPATPTISTSQQPATGPVGTSIADKATVSEGFNPTGTVTFNLYNNPSGTGTPLFTDTEPLSGGMATSTGFTPSSPGTSYWVATYNGDSNNVAVRSGTASEPVVILTPSITTSQQPATATVGTPIADKATISNAYPTGTVTFNLYNNSSGTGTPLFTDANVPLVSGMATSTSYTTTATGTFYWVATYTVATPGFVVSTDPAQEPVTITAAMPTISTSQQPATATVGTSIADKATVSGGFNPTGTVTFNLYNNPSSTGTPLFTDTELLSGGMATSKGHTTTAAGTVYWVATYDGDSNNSSVSSGTASEPVTITLAVPTINTSQQPPTATVGTSIADKATVSGGFNPSGTVTFKLYNNPSGTGAPLFTDTDPLSGGMASSKGYTTTAAGTVYWVATYDGDSNNSRVSSGTASEPVSITRATPTINTSQQPPMATVGTSIADKATVSGGFNPTGTVSFNLYDNPNGTGTPLFTDPQPLVGGMATSTGYIATATGTAYWVATYNGDSNNLSVTSGTALEPVVITPATPTISTSAQPPTAAVGTSIADKATVSGGFNPTGTVTFHLYNNPSGTGTPLFTDTEPLSAGMATSKGYTTTATGTVYWVAAYNGDSNNSAVTSGTALEPVVIGPAAADVSVAKIASAPTAVFGTNFTYTLVVHNSGPATATNVFVIDQFPTGLTFVSAPPPSQGTFTFDPSKLQGTWNVGTLAVNGSATLQIVAQVASIGPIVNTATVLADQPDPDPSNNSSSVTVTGLQGPGQIGKGSFLSSTNPLPIVTATTSLPVGSTFSAATFAGSGVFRHSDSTGWQELTAADASTVAVDDHGNVVATFFNGLWRYEDASGWQRLSPAIPSQIAIAGNGIVVADFPGNGLWRFGDPRSAGGGWQQLAPSDPLSIGVDDAGDTIASLPGNGTFLYQDGRGWQEMSPAVAQQVSIATSGNSAAVVFQGQGVWRYNFQGAGAGWQQLTPALALGVAIGPTGSVVCQFNNGVWLYQNTSGWVQLTPALATQVAITKTAEVLAEFGNGVWEFTSSGWRQLTPANATWLGGAGG